MTGCEEVLKAVQEAQTRKWNPTIPLREDLHLQSFPPLQDEHRFLNFIPSARPKLSQEQEVQILKCFYFGSIH